MTEHRHRGSSIEALHRMIIYVREEALRLRLMEVALLLEHAEDAVMAFAVPALGPGRTLPVADASRVEH